MFTGFASENTPAIQVWDLFTNFASASVNRRISLADDCAPIQVFKTGINTVSIFVYLPSSPVEGKQIKIINAMFGGFSQTITLYSSDTSGSGSSSAILVIGAGQTVDICYSKNFISTGSGGGNFSTGWITLNSAPSSSANYNSVVLGGTGNRTAQPNSSILGGISNFAEGTNSAVVGGSGNTANGLNSIAIGGQNCTSSSNHSFVSGNSNTASGSAAFVAGGTSNTASGGSSFVTGDANQASNGGASVLGGSSNTANGSSSAIVGGQSATTRLIVTNRAFGSSSNVVGGGSGSIQAGLIILGRQTTDATATVLTSNTSAASTTNQVILPNNSAYMFQGTVIANVTSGNTTSGWKFEGVIKRGANAASTVLVAAVTPTVIAQDAGAATWVLAVTADTTNGGIAVTVTGAAATTIRWVCKIETTEVTF